MATKNHFYKLFSVVFLSFIYAASAHAGSAWSGFYGGATIGSLHHEADWDELDDDWYEGEETATSDDVYLGLYSGYSWRSNNFVYGLEADIGWANNESSDNLSKGEYDDVENSELNYLATLKVRAGMVVKEDFLFFVTAGGAWANFENESSSFEYPDQVYDSFDKSVTGWVAGGGAEYMLKDGAAIRFEVLHYDFGSQTEFQNGDSERARISNTARTIRVGYTVSF